MKGLKLSKTSWLILSAGIFIVVLAGLGVTRSGQMKKQGELSANLSSMDQRVENINIAPLQAQLQALQIELGDNEELLEESKDRLHKTVVSVDVSEKLYEIAEYYNVIIVSMGTTTIAEDDSSGVNLSLTTMHVTATGDLSNIVDFLIGMNNEYVAGNIRGASLVIDEYIDELTGELINTAVLDITVYINSFEEG